MAIGSNYVGSIGNHEWQSEAIRGNQRQSEAIMSVPASHLKLMCVQMIEEAWEAAEDCIIGEL
jgi:hypothetical protein